MLVVALIATAFVGAHLLSIAAGGTLWGLHHLRYLGPAGIVGVIAACALTGWWSGRGVRRPGRAGLDVALAAASLAVFWILRDRSHLLGDGSLLLAEASGELAYHPREPLSIAIVAGLHRVAAALGREPAPILELASCLCGAITVFLLARLDRRLEGGGLFLALALVHGGAQLFFGYVEVYPLVALVTVAFLIATRSAVERAGTLLPVLLLFSVALLLHLSSVVLLPALAIAVVLQLRLRTVRGKWLLAAEVAATIVFAVLVWSAVFRTIETPSLLEYVAALTSPGEVGLPGSAERASVAHLAGVANLLLLLAPIALGVLPVTAARPPQWHSLREPWALVLGATSIAFVGAMLLFVPRLGAPRDWDALAAGAFPLSMLAALLVLRHETARRWAPGLAALAVFHAAPWILVNARPAAATARFEELPLPAGQTSFVMGVRAMKEGRFEEAEERFRLAVQEAPGSTHAWYNLGIARLELGRPEEGCHALREAVRVHGGDHRVSRVEILERLARAEWDSGQRVRARATWGAVLEEDPDSLPARTFLAVVALGEGSPAEALALLEPLLPRRGEHPSILMLTAQALRASGRAAEAAAREREAVALFPDHPALRRPPER